MASDTIMEEYLARSWKEALISRIVQGLERDSFQRRPYFPDLLNQPDLLRISEPGKLIAVFAYKYRVSWRSVLGSLEDLFETKLHVGEHTAVVALLIPNGDGQGPSRDGLELLQNTFDSFLILDQDQEVPSADLAPILDRTAPKVILKEFLSHEREQVRLCLKRFSEGRYRPLVQQDHASEFVGRRELEERIAQRLRELLGVNNIVREPLIQNVKGYLGELRRQYSFEFDFGIPGHPNRAIEIVRAGRYGSRDKIRYLMTKGRLLRYEIIENQLRPIRRDFRPILIVDGNIAGPDHDPYRYVRALVSVGWEIFRADQLEELPRFMHNADFQG